MNKRHTILVVDDEPEVVASVRDLLRLDYRVLGATSASEAMGILESEEAHVILTDQRMPGTDGVEFLGRVRGAHPDAIRILFTGYADIKAVIAAINQGSVYRYISKPWDPEELQSIVKQATGQYDLLVERKELVAELEQKNEELGRAVEELRRADELKSAFIKVASHELRTPLTIVLGLVDLARRTPNAWPELQPWLTGIHKAGQRLNHIVHQLTQMLSSGRFDRPLDLAETDLAGLLLEAAGDVRPFVDQRHQELLLDLAADLGPVQCDAAKVRDCVDNLLLNAIKFTPDAGKIALAARRAGPGRIAIQVRDTGVGIDGASRPLLFRPFFTRLDVSRHASGRFEFDRRGLGLGLALVKTFVEMHGGEVTVESEVGRGSTFTITLPL